MWVLIFLAGGTLTAYAQTDEAPKKRFWWESNEVVEAAADPDTYVGIPAPHTPASGVKPTNNDRG